MTTRATADLRPGDTVRAAGPTVRTLRENIHPRPGSRWHVLRWEDGSSFWSACDDTWELPEPCPLHGTACNPQDNVHARAHRAASQALKTFHYALLYSPGADPEAQRQAWEMLERIPR